MIAGLQIVTLHDDWDLNRLNELRSLLEAAAGAEHVIIDLSGARFIDSAVLGEFVRMVKKRDALSRPHFVARRGGGARRVLEIVGLTRVCPAFETTEETARAFKRQQ